MISRVWHGWTTPANADAYEALLRHEIFEGIVSRNIPGFQKIELGRRDAGSEVEFVTIMWFDTLSAVRAFAGPACEVAVVPPAARALLARFDERSAHYEVREARGGQGIPAVPVRSSPLAIVSVISVLLLVLHLAGDVAFGMEAGGPSLLIGVAVLAAFLYGALALRHRLAGEILMFVGGLFSLLMPIIHTRGAGVGGTFARSDGAFLFIATLLGLGVTGTVAILLALQRWSARRRTATVGFQADST